MSKIHFFKETVNRLGKYLQKAFSRGDLRLVKRITALLWLTEGKTPAQVAETLGVTVQTIYNWFKAFLHKKFDSLVYGKSPGRKPKLTKTQKETLKEKVKAGPIACGYHTACWSALLIQSLIQKEFGVLYNRNYVCELLHNLGFSFQKAKFVSDHLDEEKRREWMKNIWPKIYEEARSKNALLLFVDEASFAQWGSLSYTWATTGEQPCIKTSGRRKGYKVFGAIDYFSGQLIFHSTEERFKSDTYQEFMEKVLHATTKPVIIIHDGARYHTSRSTKDFFARHADRITVYQLSSYSPDYNPIEFLWKKVKTRSTHNQYFPEFHLLTVNVDAALSYFATHPEEVISLMGNYYKKLAGEDVA